MTPFSTSLLVVAEFLIVLANSAVPSPGSSQTDGALTNNSMLKRVFVLNNGSSRRILSELEQARKSLQAVPTPRAHTSRVTAPVVESQVLHQLRLEMIKVQILKKLHMDQEPTHIARPDVRLPEPLADLSIDDNKPEDTEQFRSKKTQVIVMAEKVSRKTPDAGGQSSRRITKNLTLKFRFTENVYTSSVDSAFLWIRKRQNSNIGGHNLRISLEGDVTAGPLRNKRKRLIRTNIKTKGAWLIISLKNVVQQWIDKDRSKNAPNYATFIHTLAVSCTNCTHPNSLLPTAPAKYRPFLVIDVSSPSREIPRKKRSINTCRPGVPVTDCCRQTFYVSFKALNWSNWVVQPQGFYANYCTGSCKGAFATKYHHTFLMRKLSVYQADLEPCCAPTKLSGLSLLYFGNGHGETLLKRDLPDMRVEECGCT